MPTRRLASTLALAALALAAAGCPGGQNRPSGADGTTTTTTTTQGGGAGIDGGGEKNPGSDTLVIAWQSDADSFTAFVAQSASDGFLYDNMFRALTRSEFDCRLTYPPDLAASYDHPEDSLSITYHLHRDQKWSDGTPITAADVAYTYELIADPVVASPRLSYVEHMVPGAAPRVIDDYTVRFEFTHAYDRITQLAHTGINIYPKHEMQKYDRGSLRGSDFDKNPVVSGAWMLGKWDRGSSVTLVPNPAYTGPDPATLSRVIFKIIPEYATRLIELENGSVDMIESIQTVEDIGRLEASRPNLKFYNRGKRFLDYVAWNIGNPLFREREVRRALTMAIDRDKLIKDLMTASDGKVYGVEAVSWITPELCDVQVPDLEKVPFDPARARQVLEAHGWGDRDGDGILDKDGKPFRFELLTNAGNARRAKAVIIIQAMLRQVGVDAQVQQVESNAFFERLRKRDYDSALSGWSAALFVDPVEVWHTDPPGGKYEFNFTSYSNPEADRLMEEGMRTADPQAAAEIWRQLQAVIYEDQPYTFLFWRDEIVALDKRFRDAKVDILSMTHDMHEWWVPADEVKYKY